MKVVLLGGGGHGEVVADILLAERRNGRAIDIVGFVDNDPNTHGRYLVGGRVLGPESRLPTIPHDALIVSIGDNARRRSLFLKLQANGERFATARHPASVLAPDVRVGEGSMIAAGVIVNPGSKVGRNVILNTASSIDHHCVIGNHAHIAPGARLGGGVSVGDIALVGIGAVVLPGVAIGPGAVIGGGAVVIRNVPAGLTVAGNPAHALASDEGGRG